MTVEYRIVGNNGKTVDVSDNRELFITQRPSTANKVTLTTVDAGLTVLKPSSQKRPIVTGLILNASRTVGVNGASVEIYESLAADSSVVAKPLLTVDLAKNQTEVIAGLVIELSTGVFINAKSDDVDINVSLLHYFVDL